MILIIHAIDVPVCVAFSFSYKSYNQAKWQGVHVSGIRAVCPPPATFFFLPKMPIMRQVGLRKKCPIKMIVNMIHIEVYSLYVRLIHCAGLDL